MSFGSIFDPLILTPHAANLIRRWQRSRGILLHLIPEEAGGRDEARRGCDGGDGSLCGVGVGGGRALVPACPSPRLVLGPARNMRSKGRGPDSLPQPLQHRGEEEAGE